MGTAPTSQICVRTRNSAFQPVMSTGVLRSAITATDVSPLMLFGKKDAPPPTKGGKKGAKKGGKKVAAKKAAPQRPEGVGIFRTGAEPNIVQKIFAMPFIGGGKGVELGSEYEL